jgi:hypothetical protein
MPLRSMFTATEREKMGVLVNNLSAFAAQIVAQSGADLSARAIANLAKLKHEQEELLKRLDELAREQSGESALRLIADLPRVSADLAQMLTLASAFLGHLLAQPTHPQAAAEALGQEKRLH